MLLDDDYPAAFYAALHTGTPGDLELYRQQSAGASAIAEFGCGYGRVLQALVAPGRRVTGVDVHPGMLALAKARLHGIDTRRAAALDLRRGDMTSIDLQASFDRVFIPHSGLYCLPSADAVLRCLVNARRHLTTRGRVVVDAYAADDFHHRRAASGGGSHELGTIAVDGRRYRVHERSRWWRNWQRVDVVYQHVPLDGGPVIETCIRHQYVLREQLLGLVRAAGLRVVDAGVSLADSVVVIAEVEGADGRAGS